MSDVSVRVAWADDAPAIAEVQLRTWRADYAGLLPAEALPGPEAAEATAAAWHASLTRPPSPEPAPISPESGRSRCSRAPGKARD